MSDTKTLELVVDAIVEVKRGGGQCPVDVAKLPTDILGRIFVEGLKTVIGDTASGASSAAYGDDKAWRKLSKDDKNAWVESNVDKIAEFATSAMETKRDKLMEGEWSLRAGDGPAYTEVDKEMFSLPYFDVGEDNLVSARYIVRQSDREGFKGMPDLEFMAHCAEWLAALPEDAFNALRAAAVESLETKRKAAEARKAGAIKIKL